MSFLNPFSGSYAAGDVEFLLTQCLPAALLSVADKEVLLQTGTHYSEVLSVESPPTPAYIKIFQAQLRQNKAQLALDVLRVAYRVAGDTLCTAPIAIVSLARAGTPVGVLLRRTLREKPFNRQVNHYSVSILKDKGLDLNALAYIAERHTDQNIIFVDGWTGKGVIGNELRKSVARFNQQNSRNIAARLYVLSDLSHTADVCATHEDYLIPSAMLNACVSGLISRTFSTPTPLSDTFHGCTLQTQLAATDQSQHLVDTVFQQIKTLLAEPPPLWLKNTNSELKRGPVSDLVKYLMLRYDIPSDNFVKPGVCEATRVLLRRKPERLLVKNKQDSAVEHLLYLASQCNIPVEVINTLPCLAVSLISSGDTSNRLKPMGF